MKYRLIKTYPNSPELGAEAKFEKNAEISYDINSGIQYLSIIKNYPEYWEKVAEKDYEILCYSRAFNRYSHSLTKRDESWDIHMIKRLSDGVIFSIGDKIDGYSYTNRVILNIELANKKLLFRQCLGYSMLEDIKHSKQPLFTTEDGVDIYEGDKIWFVDIDYWIPEERISKKRDIYKNRGLFPFSTKEKAEEYIIMNKPCLSIEDFKKIFTNARTSIIEPLKELVKSKLNG